MWPEIKGWSLIAVAFQDRLNIIILATFEHNSVQGIHITKTLSMGNIF